MNVVEILVTGKNLARPAMDSATSDARGLGGIMGKMGVVSGAALAGIAVESVKMASEFQSATTRLVTSAGESDKNIDMVRKGMLDMAGQVGISATKLSDGMYTIESAGFHGAQGLTVLKAAAQGAKAENADLATVSNAVTDVLVDYHLKASAAADVTSKLITAVSFGKTSFQDLSGSMHTILPLAASMHLGMADVTGVLAEMTAHGVSADQATQQMANAMRNLAAPTGTMQKEFKLLGTTSKEVTGHLSSQGLAGTMQYLSQVALRAGAEGTPAYTAALKKLMGTASGLQVALLTTGENAAGTQAAIKGIGAASADSSGNVKGFADVQKTLAQQVAQLQAKFDSLMIELGQKLIPVITAVVGWMEQHQSVVLRVAAAVGILMAGLIAYSVTMKVVSVVTKVWAAAQWLLNAALDANPISLVVLALVALAAGLVWAYQKSETFRLMVATAFAALATIALTEIQLILDALKAFADGVLSAAIMVLDAFAMIPGPTQSAMKSAANAVKGFKNDTDNFFNGAIGTVKNWRDSVQAMPKKIILQGNLDDLNNKINAARAKLATVPAAQKTALLANIDQLLSARDTAQRALDGLHDKTVTVYFNGVNQGTLTGGGGYQSTTGQSYAHGGVVSTAATGGVRSGRVLVGEHGPELVHLPTGSTVRSNPDTMADLAGMHGGSGNRMVLEIHSGGSKLDDAIVEIFRKAVRVRGGNVQIAVMGK